MKKISQINEGMWGSALKRSNTCELRKEDISNILTEMGLSEQEYTINDDDSVDINLKSCKFGKAIRFPSKLIINGRLPIKFRYIKNAHFIIPENLIDLSNMPKNVDGIVACYFNTQKPKFTIEDLKKVCDAQDYKIESIYDILPF